MTEQEYIDQALALRTLWLPLIRQRATEFKCMLSPSVEDNILEFVRESLEEKRTTKYIVENIDNHIRIGLGQEQCWVKYLIG